MRKHKNQKALIVLIADSRCCVATTKSNGKQLYYN